MRIFFFLLLISISSGDKIYNSINLSDIKVELGYDVNNHCLNNITIQNKTNHTINYSIQIWRGDIWYFKHKLELKPNEMVYYDNAFITCDNHSKISIDLIKNE